MPHLTSSTINQQDHPNLVQVGDFIIRKGEFPPVEFNQNDFVLTNSFNQLVNRLASIVAISDYAVILEGPTSAGKTSTV